MQFADLCGRGVREQLVASRSNWKFDLEYIRPKLTGNIDPAGRRIVGNAVKHIAFGINVPCALMQGAQIQLTHDFPAGGIDLEDIVRLPLIGIKKAVDQFQLVDIADGPVVIRHAEYPGSSESF